MPVLPMTQVMRRLDQGQIDSLYVLFGEETYLQQEYLATLTERILTGAPRDFNYDVLHADNDALAEALGLARTLPMMASHRVVVLRGVQQLRKADLTQLEHYAQAPSESTALLCTSSELNVNKISASLRQNAVVVACKRLTGTQLQQWVARQVAWRQTRITPEAVEGLLHEQEHDLQLLAHELDKLCTYVGEEGEISLADVHDVCQASRHQSLFTLSDALGARRLPQALALIDRLLQQGEPPLVVLSMIVRHVRLLWSIKQLTHRRQDMGHMAKTLGLPQHVCRQLITYSRQVSGEQLQRLYSAAIEADLAFKTSNKPPQAILERLILALCAEH